MWDPLTIIDKDNFSGFLHAGSSSKCPLSPVPSLCGWTPCRCEVRQPAPAAELRQPLSFPERQVTGSILVGVFGLCPPVPGPKLLSPLGFPGRWGVFCSDEVTLGGTGAPERPGHGLKLGTFRHPPSSPLEKEEGLQVELTMDHVFVMKPP